MTVFRSDIERAVNDLISNEGGMGFQRIFPTVILKVAISNCQILTDETRQVGAFRRNAHPGNGGTFSPRRLEGASVRDRGTGASVWQRLLRRSPGRGE
jgi:hypothetical protein